MSHTKVKCLHLNLLEGAVNIPHVVACHKESNDDMPYRWSIWFGGMPYEDLIRSIWDGLVGGNIQISKTTSGNMAKAYRRVVKEGGNFNNFRIYTLKSTGDLILLYAIVNPSITRGSQSLVMTDYSKRPSRFRFGYQFDGLTPLFPLSEVSSVIEDLNNYSRRYGLEGTWRSVVVESVINVNAYYGEPRVYNSVDDLIADFTKLGHTFLNKGIKDGVHIATFYTPSKTHFILGFANASNRGYLHSAEKLNPEVFQAGVLAQYWVGL